MIIRYEVFDEDYVPEEILFRDGQIERIAFNLKPAEQKSRPFNMLCLGPPATGKTTVMKYILKEAPPSLIGVYVNCQIHQTKQQIFSKIFDSLYGYFPPSGTSFQKLYSAILKKGVEEDRVIFVVLDDVNFLSPKLMNDIIYLILKGHEDHEGFKAAVAGISTDAKISAAFDAKVMSVFHPDEILFPVYDFDEMLEILKKRAEAGIIGGRVSQEALEFIAGKAFEYLDIRFGIHLLKMAVISADRKSRDSVSLEDAESVFEDGRTVFFRKLISALDREDLDVLKFIYGSDIKFTSEIYEALKGRMGYTKFYEILRKLENLRLIDTAAKYEKGLKRYVVRRFRREEIFRAIEEFGR
ncbi:AAA family ATPase [Geoglobus acetivorans]|uniref:AAA family ATPase n=1 Tax=Geoglobus acetivorans TaxID=565033 RepID=A0ABZ3H631_GEOAI|nr:AAA family ATPase [Geoglobus acetivorans]